MGAYSRVLPESEGNRDDLPGSICVHGAMILGGWPMFVDYRKTKRAKPHSNGLWRGVSTTDIGNLRIGPHEMKGLSVDEKAMAKASEKHALGEGNDDSDQD